MSGEPARPPPDVPADEAGLAKGATIGRYVVLGLLGRGGMGEVYAAYDPELDRKIAVKLLRARGGSSQAVADGRTRLLREAQAIARLSHPNVVVVYDIGTFKESVFIAMEFVDGHTFGYWLQAATRSWREVLDVYLAAGRGLIAAHAAGLVHRDFKPDNVMLTKGGQVRVMDFGLARQQNDDDAPSPAGHRALEAAERAAALAETFEAAQDLDATAKLGGGGGGGNAEVPSSSGRYLGLKLTQTGAILGTPAYMAPEQFAGDGGDARADQFAFCVALYEGLYGRRPFAGDNAVALMANVMAGTITEPPPETKVPTWIRGVLLRGLATTRDERFASMTDLLAALSHDPAVRRRRWLGAMTVAVLAVGIAAGAHRITAGQRAICAGGPSRAATAWGPQRRDAVERAFLASGNRRAALALAGAATLFDQYVARWTGMYRETCEATQVRGEQSAEVLDLRMGCLGERLSDLRALTEVFSTADSGVVDNAVSAAGALPTLDRCADVAMLRAVIRPPDDPTLRAKVAAAREEVSKVNAIAIAGQCERAKAVGTGVLEQVRRLGYLPLEAEAFYALGRLADDCLDPQKSVEYLEDASLSAEAAHHDEIAVAASIYFASLYADRIWNPHLSRYWARHAEAVLSRFPGHPILEAWISVARASSLSAEGRDEEALVEDRRALALKEAALGRMNADTGASMINVGDRLHTLGRDAEAIPLGEETIALFTKLFGADSTRVAHALINQAECLTAVRRFDEAGAAIERAIAIWRSNHATFFVGYGLLDRGRLSLAEGHPELARTDLQQAVALLGNGNPAFAAEAKLALARAMWSARRDRPAAVALARQARSAIGDGVLTARQAAELDGWLRAHPAL